ncbi:locomotion-related protein Hikaru genki-like isoform X2 [Ischnura elegans]|uniref:locomotion-related protein Hikaru genki-like isoform X2 n=1 Tax=Ischnura elegans TaxID=197161 RepID=UPI001ED8BBEC|nr:locomotion-related protein Hikaru genki-like isoform X2 [Ischnura elegans]
MRRLLLQPPLAICLAAALAVAAAEGGARGWTGQGCQPPAVARRNGALMSARDRVLTDYEAVTEVKFPGEIGPLGARRLCKIKCVGGQWVGPLCLAEGEDAGRFHPLLRSCRLERTPPHLLVTYSNVTISPDAGAWFPHGAQIIVRCKELGVYKLLGESALECRNGAWSSRLPACVPTTLLTNYSEGSPPTVLVRIPSGSASAEPSGDLAVFPGTILHLECLFSRKLGNPEWSWTSTFRQYLTGWAIAPEERDWKYRLSIYYSKPLDSGVFTCSTPRGITNSISVKVVAVHCEPLDVVGAELQPPGASPAPPATPAPTVAPGSARVPSTARVEGHRLGQTAHFHCPLGYALEGPANLTCRASGRWSGRPPTCLAIQCPPLHVQPPLSVVEHNASYGGRAVFRCPWGHALSGPPGIECEATGQWSGKTPTCQVVECPAPPAPDNGRIVTPPVAEGSRRRRRRRHRANRKRRHGGGERASAERGASERSGSEQERREAARKKKYAAGTAVQFACAEGHQMLGESSILCTEAGVWSHPPPFCKVRCPYPGDPANGRIAPLKFFYEPGDRIAVSCDAGFVARLADVRPACRPDGTWTHPPPTCTNYREV